MIITLNINGLNSLIKKQKWQNGLQKNDQTICYLQETYFRFKDTNMLKVKGWESTYHANSKQERAGMAILILDKIGFKTNILTREKNNDHSLGRISVDKVQKYTHLL